MTITLSGHVWVCFEDRVLLRYGEIARSNAHLVEKIVNIARELDVHIATPDDAREVLWLRRS